MRMTKEQKTRALTEAVKSGRFLNRADLRTLGGLQAAAAGVAMENGVTTGVVDWFSTDDFAETRFA